MGHVPIELGSAKTFCRSTILSQGPRLPASSPIYMKSSITCCIAPYPMSVLYSLTVPCQDWYSLAYNLLAEQQTLLDSQRRSIWFSFVGATVAHRTSNPKVAGSSPARSIFASKIAYPYCRWVNGGPACGGTILQYPLHAVLAIIKGSDIRHTLWWKMFSNVPSLGGA